MKIEELSIGDWVYGFDGKPNPVRISALDIYPLNRTPRIVTYGGYGYQIEHLSPIPLTSEILEKNFEKKVMFGIFDDYFDLEIHEINDGTFVVNYHICEMSLPDECIMICFVHQLQHALRHFGIEKKIVL